MLSYEIKKCFSKIANKIGLLILTVVLIIVSYFAVTYVDYVDEDGNNRTGIIAVRSLRDMKNQWAGYITEDVLREVIVQNALVNASAEYQSNDVQENNKAYSKKQGFSDIRDMINHAFCGFREYNYYRADSVTTEEVSEFYTKRISNLEEWLYSDEAKDQFTDMEKQFLIKQYEQLEIPLYYEYADGWIALLEYAPSIIMLTVLITGFFVSGIFSNEFQLKADAIYFSTKYGRNKAVKSKVEAGGIIITIIYWVVVLLYSAIVLGILGADGANCAIQAGFGSWKSFYNITYFENYLLTMVGGYIGSLFILTISMLISAKTKSTVLSVTVPFIFVFLPSFLSGFSALTEILGLLPDQLLQMNVAIKYFNLYQFGDRVIGAVPIIMILYAVLYVLMVPILYRVYQKAEIK